MPIGLHRRSAELEYDIILGDIQIASYKEIRNPPHQPLFPLLPVNPNNNNGRSLSSQCP